MSHREVPDGDIARSVVTAKIKEAPVAVVLLPKVKKDEDGMTWDFRGLEYIGAGINLEDCRRVLIHGLAQVDAALAKEEFDAGGNELE